MADRKLKVREIAKMVNISTGSASTILNEKLGMKKVFCKWVPRLLTMEQKQQRVDDFTPESKRQSAEWRAAGESRTKRPKTQQSAGKVMASVFWDAHGI